MSVRSIARRGNSVGNSPITHRRGRSLLKKNTLLATAVGTAIGAIFTAAPSARAASQTWTGLAGDGLWASDNNWTGVGPGNAPGDFSGASPDVATFNNNVSTLVTIDPNRSILSMLFDTASAGAFTFSGGPLVLNAAGSITMNASVANTQTFNNPFFGVAGVANTTYSFLNNSSTVGANMNITGSITGQMAAATTETFILGGSGNGTFSGALNNGGGGGAVALSKTGAGTWTVTGTNTYTGATNATGGILALDFSAAGAPASNIVSASSQLQVQGGTFNIIGSSTGPTNQTFSGVAIIRPAPAGAGNNSVGGPASHINVTPGTGQTATLTFTATTVGNLATSVNGQTHNIIQFGKTGTIKYPAALSAPLLTNNHNNGYATFGTDDWAATDATGTVVAATYTNLATGLPTTVTSTTQANITGSNATALTNNALTIGSLRFADPGNLTLTLGTGTVTGGGILMASTSGGATINGGTMRANRGGATTLIDFNIIQNSTLGDLTINSAFTIPSGSQSTMNKSGPGRLILTNTGNAWGGDTTRLGTSINEGILSVPNNGALGTAGASIGMAGGTLEITGNMSLDTGGTFRPVILGTTAPISITGANKLTIPGVISGIGPLVKTNTGVLSVSGVNTFTAGTQVNNGTLLADNATNSLGAGAVNVNSTGRLGGIGTITGTVNVNNGGHLVPGDNAVGALTAASATVNTGGSMDFEINPGANDLLNLTAAVATQALTVNTGAGFNVLSEGSAAPWTINGTYNLINVTNGGTVTGLANLAPLNAPVGVTYGLAQVGNLVQLTITGGSNSVTWNTDANTAPLATWNTASNWTPTVVPTNPGDAATFGSAISGARTITLDGNHSLGQLTFISSNSYTIAQGTGAGTLSMNSGTAGNAFVSDKLGSHTVSAPVALVSNTTVSITNSTDVLTISGPVSGGGQLIVGGAGTLQLTGTNGWGGGTTISSGTLMIGNGTTAGTLPGNVLDNGTLAFNHSDPLNVTNVISGSGGVTQLANSVLTLGVANSYLGNTTVNAGSVKLGVAGSLGTGILTLAGTTSIDLNGNNATMSLLNGTGTVDSSVAATMNVNITGGGGSFTGSIKNTNGTLSLTKSGVGTQTIVGNNTFSGGATVNGGAFRITNSTTGAPNAVTAGPLGTGTLTLNIGPGLLVGGTSGSSVVFDNSISVGGGASANSWVDVVDPGVSATITGTVTIAANAQYRLQTTGLGSTLTLTGNSTIPAATQIVIFNQGNISFAGTGSLNDASSTGISLGRATQTGTDDIATHMTLTLKDSASINNTGTGGIQIINQVTATALPASATVTVQDNAILNAGAAGLNFNNSTLWPGVNPDPVYNVLKGTGSGGTIQAGSFSYTNLAVQGHLTVDGGILAAGANDPVAGQWFPALNMSVQVGAQGMTLNSNAFNVTMAQSFSESAAGATLTKTGTGSVIISGSNSFTGATKASQGLLEFTSNSGYSGTPSISAAAGGAVGLETSSLDPAFLALLIASPTANVGGLALATPDAAANLDFTTGTLADPKLVGMSVGGIVAGVSYTGTITPPVGGPYRLGGGGSITLPNANQLAGTRNVQITNGGTVVLGNSNNYVGTTTVDFGTKLVASNASGSATSSGNITVNNGTLASGAVGSVAGNVLAGTGPMTIAPGNTGAIGSLTVGGLTTSGTAGSVTTLNFDVGPGPAVLVGSNNIVTNGDLLTLGAGTVSVAPGTAIAFGVPPVTSGSIYRLIGGSIGGINLANFTLPTSPNAFYSLSNTVDPGFIDVSVVANLTWNNTGATAPTDGVTWDVNNNINWNNSVSAVYKEGDFVNFTDTNNAHLAVTIPSVVHPGGTTVNAAGNYVFSGAGGIGGSGGLAKSGTGSLTINTVNTYTGNTTVTAGTLNLGATGSIASPTITVTTPGVANFTGTLSSTATVNANGATNFTGTTTGPGAVTQALSALNIGTASTVTITHSTFPGSPKIVKATNTVFTDATSLLNITNNAYITTGTAASALTKIQANQIFTNEAADPNKAIGYIDLTGADAGKYEVRYTLKGDADLNGGVDVGDLGALATSYGITGGMSWGNGDFNQDHNVDVGDLGALATNYGTSLATGPSFDGGLSIADPAAVVAASAAVPEPTSLGLLAIGAIGLCSRRRRMK